MQNVTANGTGVQYIGFFGEDTDDSVFVSCMGGEVLPPYLCISGLCLTVYSI